MFHTSRHSTDGVKLGVERLDLNVNGSNAMVSYFNKASEMVWFLLIPEDSTDQIAKQQRIKPSGRYDIHGGLKTGFWIVISIILAALIGQLN